MNVSNVFIEGLKLIEPSLYYDERGAFFESYNQEKFANAGITDIFIQDNQSQSNKGVLRGLHFQTGQYAQAKLVRVIKGSVIDVAVDLRNNSSTFGKYFAIELNDKNNLMFYIPVGFAHGFVALEDQTIFVYKCTALYNKESEGGIIWNDSTLGINWAYNNPIISLKDSFLPPFDLKKSFF
jgi:dTDP-4-dehydrorhamnose 3,5-epimerase